MTIPTKEKHDKNIMLKQNTVSPNNLSEKVNSVDFDLNELQKDEYLSKRIEEIALKDRNERTALNKAIGMEKHPLQELVEKHQEACNECFEIDENMSFSAIAEVLEEYKKEVETISKI